MLMRREHSPKPPPELWERVLLARKLNEMHGCHSFHCWNVGDIPDVDLAILDAWASLDAQQRAADVKTSGDKQHGV